MAFIVLLPAVLTRAQQAQITDTLIEFTTYPFSDPNPVPETGRIYPYFYFHGYTNQSIQKKWKMVILENAYIKVYVCPEIGGKVWGAIEKSTGKEFLYFNHVVKFRDIAMRGAWTSGGLEYNFGDIGHIPSCATPVDYITTENDDGSVSCVVGAIDLPSGTRWNVEIKVSPGKAYFETRASWFNNTELPCTYYHWMNAAAKASDDLEFIYPGKNWIGHGTETGSWPGADGRDLAWYKNNDFGSYKSYHVVNSYSDYFGGYWHDSDFGFGHYSDFDEKPGKKLWIWGLSEQGMIWEDLLTDKDGQYIEFQAGKLYNQAAGSSSKTPFKHREFAPHDADIMNEIWFPLKGTGGMVAVSPHGVLNLIRENKQEATILLSALQAVDDELRVFINGENQLSFPVKLKPLEIFTTSIEAGEADTLEIILGDKLLSYTTPGNEILVDRPLLPAGDFNWDSAYGLYLKGLELEKQRAYADAEHEYLKALEQDPGFLPALNRLALGHYRKMDLSTAHAFVLRALAIDTYDGEANYLLGLICRNMGDRPTSKSGFSIAMGTVAYRSAAAAELANTFLSDQDWGKAERYARKALNYNNFNMDALQTLAIAYRKQGRTAETKSVLDSISTLDGSSHFRRFEQFLLTGDTTDRAHFVKNMTNEFPQETCLDLAIRYTKKGCTKEALQVLELAAEDPVVDLWLAYLDPDKASFYLNRCLDQPVDFVFPHRIETAGVIEAMLGKRSHWKLHYYYGLILWSKGELSEAQEQFNACGDEPDYAPFYLARVKLGEAKEDQLNSLTRATELAPEDWRAAQALTNYHMAEQQPEKAVSTIAPFVEKYPEQSAIGLSYAQALTAAQQFEEALSFLENYRVLPFEGATAGRDLYNEACLRSALNAFREENYASAIAYAQKAKTWPLNLGVGRPYDVDERLEDYLLYHAWEFKGNKKEAAVFDSNVMNYTLPEHQQERSKLYLQLDLLYKHGRSREADSLLEKYTREFPGNKYIEWAGLKLKKDPGAASIEAQISRDNEIPGPYDPPYHDKNFQLLLDVLEGIGE